MPAHPTSFPSGNYPYSILTPHSARFARFVSCPPARFCGYVVYVFRCSGNRFAPLASLASRPAIRLGFTACALRLAQIFFFKRGFIYLPLMFLACVFCLGLVRCASGLLVGWWGAGALAPKPPRAPFGRAPAPPPPEVTIYLLAIKAQPLFSLAPFGVCGRRLESGESRCPEMAA